MFKLAEGAQRPVGAVGDERPEASRPRAVAAPAPARKALGSGAPAERRLRVAPAPRRAFATRSGTLDEKPESDQWTEL